MVVGIARVEIFILESRSLKEKRGVLRKILSRTRNKFNISAAEIGENDSWKRSSIGLCAIGNDKRFINSMPNKIMSYIEELNLAQVIDSKVELLSISDEIGRRDYNESKFDGF